MGELETLLFKKIKDNDLIKKSQDLIKELIDNIFHRLKN